MPLLSTNKLGRPQKSKKPKQVLKDDVAHEESIYFQGNIWVGLLTKLLIVALKVKKKITEVWNKSHE
jgi:hypothetical protein